MPEALSSGSRSDRSAWQLPIRAEGSCELRFCTSRFLQGPLSCWDSYVLL